MKPVGFHIVCQASRLYTHIFSFFVNFVLVEATIKTVCIMVMKVFSATETTFLVLHCDVLPWRLITVAGRVEDWTFILSECNFLHIQISDYISACYSLIP